MPWQDFHFLRPEWFIALIPLLLGLMLMVRWRKRQSGWQSVIANHLYTHMVSGKASRRSRPPYWLLACGWVLAVVALAGPTWERLPQPVFQLKTGHVVLMDMSLSMRATDVSPDRLTRAKYKAIDLIKLINEGEMGLVAYAGDAFTISPLTADAANLTALLPSLRPEIMPVAGSDPLLGLEMASELLSNAGYIQGDIYWITDGVEISQMKELQDYLADSPFTVNILGVGTAQGAPIKQLNGELLKQASGAIVIPKLNADQLSRLSAKSGGKFTTLTANERDVKYLAQSALLDRTAADTEHRQQQQDRTGDQWAELGPYVLLFVLPLALYGFRRGLLMCLAVMLLPVTSFDSFAQQSEPAVQVSSAESLPWWKKPFLNADQQGLQSFEQQAYQQAAQDFANPDWRGAAEYKAGNYQAALEAYSQIDSLEGTYNQGNALAQLGELDAAIDKYQQVLDADPDFEDARANKELLEKLKQQQQSESDNNQQQNDQQQQDQSEQSSESQQDQSQDNQNDAQSQADSQQSNGEQGNQQPDSGQNDSPQNQPEQGDDQNQQDEHESPQEQGESPDNEAQQPPESQPQAGTQGAEMSDEEKENQRRLDNLMRRIPDDPAYLLQQKMQLEAQKRRRQRLPANRSEW